jgi:hypothetical protein
MQIPCDYEDPRLVTTPVNNGIVLSFTHIVVCTRIHASLALYRWVFSLEIAGTYEAPVIMNGLGHY